MIRKRVAAHRLYGASGLSERGARGSRLSRHRWPLLGCLLLLASSISYGTNPTIASQDEIMSDAPGLASTGVPDGVELKPSGSIVVSKPGTVIDSVDVTGRIMVKADNVTVRNSRINANGSFYGIHIARGVTGLSILDSEISGARSAAVNYGEYVAHRLNVHSSRDGLLVGSNTAVYSSWIHGLRSGAEGIKSIGGSNSVVSGNYLDVSSSSSGAALQLQPKKSIGLSNWVVQGNFFAGGKTTVDIATVDGPVDNVQIMDNTWVMNTWSRSPLRLGATPALWAGNSLSDGTVIESPIEPADDISVAMPGQAATAESLSVNTMSVVGTVPSPKSESSESESSEAESSEAESSEAESSEAESSEAESSKAESSTTTAPTAAAPSSPNSPKPTSPPTTASPPPTVALREVAPLNVAPPAPPLPPDGPCKFTNPNDPKDDPQPAYDGTRGRYPVSPNRIPAGYPTPLTTGICGAGLAPSDLTSSGGMTITEDGAVVDGLDIQGGVKVKANNVTIRNSRITATGLYSVQLIKGYTGLTMENTRVRSKGEAVSSTLYLQGFATLRGVHVTGGTDILKATNGLLVENSYFAGVYRKPGSHNDVVQIREGSNYTFRNNSMFGPWRQSTSVLIVGAADGPTSNVVVDGNYLSGGGYTVYTGARGAPFTNGVLSNNRIELDSWKFGPFRNAAGAKEYGNKLLPSP